MKWVTKRFSATMPEVLARPLPPKPSPEQLSEVVSAVLEWSARTRARRGTESTPTWEAAAVALAFEIFPCFERMRRANKGGRPKLDKPGGLFGMGNPPHRDLISIVASQIDIKKNAGEDATVKAVCNYLASNKELLPLRHHKATAGRIERLYYKGQRDEKSTLMALAKLLMAKA
jgi:hypothetical protein